MLKIFRELIKELKELKEILKKKQEECDIELLFYIIALVLIGTHL